MIKAVDSDPDFSHAKSYMRSHNWCQEGHLSHFLACDSIYAIHGGSPGWGHQITVGLSTTVIFGDLGGYFFGNV